MRNGPTIWTTPLSGGQQQHALLQLLCVALSSSLVCASCVVGSSRHLELQRPCLVEFAHRGYGAREPFGMIGGMVAVNPVALEHART